MEKPFGNKRDEELQEQQRNKTATKHMADNDERQNNIRQSKQNSITQSESPKESTESLTSKEQGRADSLPVEEKNRRKLKDEQDTDFGIE
ncbi:hypothetical protein [Flavobacterium sp. MK4S-17]|uniref:hypothetical protein n=1 Tax=Flavobacterium sp. MK4S-17 TaxID=2543737 RepID=UPI001359CAA6|nr:hypothetical protein [Flavobacterium sp. MK4S-17]